MKEWVGNFDAVWDNISLRAKIKEQMVKYAEASSNLKLLEAPFVVKSNDVFHLISEQVRGEVGSLDSKEIYSRWDDWVRETIKGGM